MTSFDPDVDVLPLVVQLTSTSRVFRAFTRCRIRFMCTYCALVRLPLNTLIPQGPRFCSSLSPNEQNPQVGFTPGTLLAVPGDLCNYNVSVALPAAPYGQMQSQANGLNFTNVRTLHTIQTHTSTQTIQYTHTHTTHTIQTHTSAQTIQYTHTRHIRPHYVRTKA